MNLDILNIEEKLQKIYSKCFQYNLDPQKNINQFRNETRQLFQTISNPNLIFGAINMFFSKKIKDEDSKFNYDCYNSLLFENISKRLVKRPDYLEVYFGSEGFQKLIEIMNLSEDEIIVYIQDADSIKDLYKMVKKNIKWKIICEESSIEQDNITIKYIKLIDQNPFVVIDKRILISGHFSNNGSFIVIENEYLCEKHIDQFNFFYNDIASTQKIKKYKRKQNIKKIKQKLSLKPRQKSKIQSNLFKWSPFLVTGLFGMLSQYIYSILQV